MRMRMALAVLISALLGIGALPYLPARAAAETKYDFEGCEQGWTAKKGGNWVRSKEHLASSNVSQAFGNTIYEDSEERGDTLISKPHNWTGGKGKIKLDARWQFEWFPAETAAAGLSTADRAVLEISTDGGQKWKSRHGFGFPNASFPEFDTLEVEFEAPAGPILFRFVLFSDPNIRGFGIEVDDIVVPAAAPDGIACKK